jgi:hypothetical protein
VRAQSVSIANTMGAMASEALTEGLPRVGALVVQRCEALGLLVDLDYGANGSTHASPASEVDCGARDGCASNGCSDGVAAVATAANSMMAAVIGAAAADGGGTADGGSTADAEPRWALDLRVDALKQISVRIGSGAVPESIAVVCATHMFFSIPSSAIRAGQNSTVARARQLQRQAAL